MSLWLANIGWLHFIDENDNFLGGLLIAQGYILYRDYFSHHLPLPYYHTALASLLGFTPPEGHRLLVLSTHLLLWVVAAFRFRRHIPSGVLYPAILTASLAHPLFWGHMVLGIHPVAFAVFPLALYILTLPKMRLTVGDTVFITVLIYVALLSNPLGANLVLTFFLLYLRQWVTKYGTVNFRLFFKSHVAFLSMLLMPGLLYLCYLFATNSFDPFLYGVFTFNSVYFTSYLFPQLSAPGHHPSQLMIFLHVLNWIAISARHIMAHMHVTALWEIEGFLLLSNAIAGLVLLRRHGPLFAVLYSLFLGLGRFRGGGFYASPYYVLSVLSVALVLYAALGRTLRFRLRRIGGLTEARPEGLLIKAGSIGMAIGSLLYIVLAIHFYYQIILAYPITNLFKDNPLRTPYMLRFPAYDKTAPAYDRYSDIVKSLTAPGDTIWFWGDPGIYIYTGRVPASRYAFYFPWHSSSLRINSELLLDLERTRPKIVIFEREATVWNGMYVLEDYGKTVLGYLQAHYTVMDEQDEVLKNIFVLRGE